MCETIDILTAMEDAGGQKDAVEELEKGIDEFLGPDLGKVLDQIMKAVEKVNGQSGLQDLVEVAAKLSRFFIDQATASTIVDQDDLNKTENYYQEGLNDQDNGDWKDAAEHFQKAAKEAQP